MDTNTLKSKTISALWWSFFEAAGLRIVQFVIGIILARLLTPSDFGLVGMLVIFMAIAQTFLDSGFGSALIQRSQITQLDKSSIFYFNIIIGGVAAGFLCGIAPWIAEFYHQSILTKLLRVLSMVLLVNAFGLVQRALLTRDIDFRTQTKITLISSFVSGMIGIGMALLGFGVWSLAFQQIANAASNVVLLWFFRRWRPTWQFSIQSLREMFGFGSKLLASGLLNSLFDNIYLIVIGRLFSPADLGFFTRAKNLQQLPSQTLSGMVSRVAFPVFSSIQKDRDRIKRGVKKALTSLVLINFPMMIGLAVVSRPFVLVLLTDKWLPCVPYLQLLCLVGLMYPLQLINLSVITALGRSDLFLRLEIMKKVLVVLNIAVTWRLGIMAMIIGQVIISFVSYYLNAHYNKALLRYSFLEQIGDLYPYLLNAILMGVAINAFAYLHILNPFFLICLQVVSGFLIYLILCHLFRFQAYLDMQHIILNRLPFRSIH
ncbi:lipopolysaccharide biosynthesis protein [Desulfosarcina ovata]|uniref:lipopolysaccharide biosynthesis protein n=1 Tax=Desulfosarcina ovata TaxID=83564 RepID=UPI0012D30016|nr:lipopolysaccharide biosynthesis protein [Desulfosarcina ovata]